MKSQIYRWIFSGLFAAALLTMGGCATGPDVRTEYDRTVDFNAYKTFAFYSPLGTDRSGYQSIVSQYLKSATRRELEARGLRYEEASPQLLVNFNAMLNEKLRVDSVPQMHMGLGYYGYRGGIYSSWPLYTNQVSSYTEGTLNIDLVDAARRQLVWEAVIVGNVTRNKLDNLQVAIDRAVAESFSKFPIAPRYSPAR